MPLEIVKKFYNSNPLKVYNLILNHPELIVSGYSSKAEQEIEFLESIGISPENICNAFEKKEDLFKKLFDSNL